MYVFNLLIGTVLLTAFHGYSFGRDVVQVPQDVHISDLWIQKFTLWFRIIDINNDGFVYKKEYVDEVAKRARQVLSPWRANAVYGVMIKDWQFSLHGKTSNTKQAINLDRFLKVYEMDLLTASVNELQIYWCSDWFHILDVDCNDKMPVDEYSKLLHITRNALPPEELFNAIDRNQNHIISLEEFLFGCNDFYFEMKDNKTALFYGSPN